MMNYAKRGAALLLALVFCLGLLPPAGAEGDTITIHDASGLLKLAQSCTSDTWSQGVTVVLAADISLAGTGFSTIPVFRGTFDVRASDINEEMKMAAAQALADLVGDDLSADYIIPAAFDPRVGPAVAKAVAEAAKKTGIARI